MCVCVYVFPAQGSVCVFVFASVLSSFATPWDAAHQAPLSTEFPREEYHSGLPFPGEGNGNPLQYPCLENFMDRITWGAAVHGVAKSGMTGQLTL